MLITSWKRSYHSWGTWHDSQIGHFWLTSIISRVCGKIRRRKKRSCNAVLPEDTIPVIRCHNSHMLGKCSVPLIIQMFGTEQVQGPAVQPEWVLCIQMSQHHTKQTLTHFLFPSVITFILLSLLWFSGLNVFIYSICDGPLVSSYFLSNHKEYYNIGL